MYVHAHREVLNRIIHAEIFKGWFVGLFIAMY